MNTDTYLSHEVLLFFLLNPLNPLGWHDPWLLDATIISILSNNGDIHRSYLSNQLPKGKLSLKLDVTLRTVHSWFHADRFNCTDAEVICLTMYFLFKMIVPILMRTRKETQYYGLNKYEKNFKEIVFLYLLFYPNEQTLINDFDCLFLFCHCSY